MKRRFMSFVLCCGLAAGTVLPAAAEELQSPENGTEIVAVGAETALDRESGAAAENDGKLQDNEGSFDINEPETDSENAEDAEDGAAVLSALDELTAPLAAVDDASTVYRASDCLDTSGNANKYWRAYYRSSDNTENQEIPAKYTVAMTKDVKLTSAGTAKRDGALLSRSSWSGRVTNAEKTPVSAGIRLMTPGGDAVVSKGFKAPKSGSVVISQENLYNSTNEIWGTAEKSGTTVKITKNSLKNTVWSGQALNSSNGGICAFNPITVSVAEGDILWFDVSAASGTLEVNKWVHWNPVITYQRLDPTVLSLTASNGSFDNAALSQSYSVKYKETLNSISADNFEITGKMKDGSPLSQTPSVYEAQLADNTVTVSFAGLEKGAEYTVLMKNLDFDGMDASEYTYSFGFSTKDEMKFSSYKASDSYSTSSNTNPVWRMQYRSDEKLYTDIAKTGAVGNGMYVVINGKEYYVGKSWSTNDWWQGFGIGQYVMIGGNDAAASATATDEVAVRTFIAPSSGYVEITACDPSGASKVWGGVNSGNSVGASLRICKTEAEDTNYKNTEQVWPAENGEFRFRWNTGKPSNGTEETFEPVTVAINKGDRLHFEAKSQGTNWWGTTVYWDPVVTYKVVFPEAKGKNFEDGGVYVPNYEFVMEYDDEMAEISPDDIEIDGGAYVKSVELRSLGSKIAFTFGGVKENTKYNVKVGGIRYAAVEDESMSTSYSFGFTSGRIVNAGEITIGGGKVVRGKNKISVDVNNSAETPCSAALAVCVMRGTADDYEVESVEYASRNDIGANDRMETEVDIADTDNVFIRAVLLESIKSLKPYAAAVDFR